jgi:hypothetical protein
MSCIKKVVSSEAKAIVVKEEAYNGYLREPFMYPMPTARDILL